MLRLSVTVRMAGIGRAHRDADGEEGQQRSDEVDARMRSLREQSETVGRDSRGDLERDQRAGRQHGDKRGSALRGHTLSIHQKESRPPWRAPA